jgi:hypothetical protein
MKAYAEILSLLTTTNKYAALRKTPRKNPHEASFENVLHLIYQKDSDV